MAVAYNPSSHDALNGDSSHFDTHFYQNDAGSFPNMDPNLSSTGVDTLNSTAAAASAHLAGNSSDYDAMLAHDASISSGAGRQSLGADDTMSITATPARSGKASRACDECRRRKSKCTDGNPETGRACAPCRARAGPDAECHYNRTPMKRGPSKGYIQAMKGNVDDVSRGQRKLLSQLEYLQIELEDTKDKLGKLMDFVTDKFGADALPPALSREELKKRVRINESVMDNYVLSLDGQKAVTHYQTRFQSVLPFLPSDLILFQNIVDQATEDVQNAFEYALRAIDTPVCSESGVDMTRAELIEKATISLEKGDHGALYFATIGLLILAIQTTGPVREYRGKLPNMFYLHDKASSSYAALRPFEDPNAAPAEYAHYIRCIAIGIRSLLIITSIGTGEVFSIINQISVPGDDDTDLIGDSGFKFAQLAETFSRILKAGLSTQPINFAELRLYETDLPLANYKIVVLTLRLLVCRLNTFTDTPDSIEVVNQLNEVIDHLYSHSSTSQSIPSRSNQSTQLASNQSTSLGPSCWLYYHGLALAVKTVGDLLSNDEIMEDSNSEALLALQKLKNIIEQQLSPTSMSGWDFAAVSMLDKLALGSTTSSTGRWRHVLDNDAYLRALDY